MSGDFWLGLALGSIIGGVLGALAMALMAAARYADERMEAYAAGIGNLDVGFSMDGDADCTVGDSGEVATLRAELAEAQANADFYFRMATNMPA